MAKRIFPPKGMKDFLPLEYEKKQKVINKIMPIYKKWGFQQIEYPSVENIDRLIGSNGGENEGLVFQILKRGIDLKHINDINSIIDLGLRYDLTVPMTRFYSTNYDKLPKVVKFLHYGYVWRAERPQKGRYRQFMQWDADIIGQYDEISEIELILCTAEALIALDLKDFTIHFNDRRILKALVDSVGIPYDDHEKAFVIIDKMDKIGIVGIQDELLNNGFNHQSVIDLCSKLCLDLSNKNIDEIFDTLDIYLDNEVKKRFIKVFNFIKSQSLNFNIIFDPTLVRGMGYYTGQIFEIKYKNYSFSIAGGGRYDNMVGKFLGKDISACGFSLGFDRILFILDEENKWDSNLSRNLLCLISDTKDYINNIELIYGLRESWDVNVVVKENNLRAQLIKYKSIGYSHFLRLDSEERTINEIK